MRSAVVLGVQSSKSPMARRASSQAAAATASMARGELQRWVKDQGGFVWSGMNLIHRGEEHGMTLVASQDLAAGNTIIALPRRLPLAMPMDGSNPRDAMLLELAQRIPEELWSLRLGLKLLAERSQKGSFWWPYISMLPQSFTVPMFFAAADLEEIDYVPLTHQVKKRCKYLLNFASELSSVLQSLPKEKHPFGGQAVDSGALGWAMAAVSSRAFRTHKVDNKLLSSAMMLPLIDMCNHSFTPNARIVEDPSKEAEDTGFLKVITELDLKQGEAVTINYGPLSNDLLLLDYGFVVPDNPHDYVEVTYNPALLENARLLGGGLTEADDSGTTSFDSPSQWQMELLKQLGLLEAGESQKVLLGGPQLVDGRLLAALRILYHREPIEDAASLQSPNGSLGVVNEQKVVRTLCVLCAILVNHFKSTVPEDEAYLARNKSLAHSTRLAVLFRMSKKKVLLRVLDELKSKLRDLLALKK